MCFVVALYNLQKPINILTNKGSSCLNCSHYVNWEASSIFIARLTTPHYPHTAPFKLQTIPLPAHICRHVSEMERRLLRMLVQIVVWGTIIPGSIFSIGYPISCTFLETYAFVGVLGYNWFRTWPVSCPVTIYDLKQCWHIDCNPRNNSQWSLHQYAKHWTLKFQLQLVATNVLILVVLKPEYSRITWSIPWLLTPWFLASPSHRQVIRKIERGISGAHCIDFVR